LRKTVRLVSDAGPLDAYAHVPQPFLQLRRLLDALQAKVSALR
jgi:hypothetical protein